MDDLQPFGDTVVAATQLGTVVIDEQGTVVQRLPAYERLTVVGDTIVGWGPTEAEFRDQEWTVRATIDTPDVDLVAITAGHAGLPAGRPRVRPQLDLHELERRAVTVFDSRDPRSAVPSSVVLSSARSRSFDRGSHRREACRHEPLLTLERLRS